MNCCKKNKNNKKGPLKFIGMMGICCLLPIILISIVPLLGFDSITGRIIPLITPFICPILMGGMIFTMFKGGNKECCSNGKDESIKE